MCDLIHAWADDRPTARGGMPMTIARWNPPVAPTRQEQFLLKRLGRVRKLLGFLRVQRHELFNDAFQDELASMYRTTGAGKDALPPAMMAMAMLVTLGPRSRDPARRLRNPGARSRRHGRGLS